MRNILLNLKNKSGIYCIINISNNKRYIGSSVNLLTRLFKHRSLLRNNKHDNIILQNAWNKYGENNFDYYILEFCNENRLTQRELFFIDTLKSEYNITKLVERNVLSPESRIKLSNTRKVRMSQGIIKTNNTKSISMYELDGTKIRTFNTIKEACDLLNLSHSSICRYLKGTNKLAGGYLWSLNHENILPAYTGSIKLAKRFSYIYDSYKTAVL